MSDLSKFGVPMPGGVRNGILHPKQAYRFRVLLSGFGEGAFLRELTQNVVSVGRPSYSNDRIELHAYNSTAYIQGKHKWAELELVVRDDISNAVISAVGAQMQKQINHFEQTSAVAGINYKFTMEIHALDGTNGEELESWQLDGCYLTKSDYSEGKYDSSDPSTITMSISFDNATQIRGTNADGITVGGDPFPNFPSPFGGARAN
jgi:hypothetical protein